MKKKRRKFSIKRRMLFILTGTLIPVVAFLVFTSFHMVRVMNDRIVESGIAALDVYASDTEEHLDQIEGQFLTCISENADFAAVSNPKSDALQLHLSSYRIMQQFKAILHQNPIVSMCAVYSREHSLDRTVWSEEIHGIDKKEAIVSALEAVIGADGYKAPNSWQVLEAGGSTFFYRVMGYRNTYVAALVNMENLGADAEDVSVIFTRDGQALTGSGLIAAHSLSVDGDRPYYFTGKGRKYLYIHQALENTDAQIGYLQQYDGFFGSIGRSELALFYINLFSLVLIPLSYLLLKKTFFRPIDQLVGTMKEVRDGREALPEDTYDEIEFEQVNTTFREMLQEISRLKIDAYEKKLQVQQVELQYYQIQIRPHFYLNCLKNIYAMLESSRDADAQTFILYLSKHLHYMLQSRAAVVTLEEELNYIRNYLMIQKLSLKYPPDCTIDGDVSLLSMKIPAISLEPFVENSVKYASGKPEPLVISIHFSELKEESGTLCHIVIRDNGCGFTEEQLKQLNFSEGGGMGSGHIGIHNVIQRLKLFYGADNVGFAFANADPGAKTEIFIREGTTAGEGSPS